jgi:hypothetical protein
MTEEYGEMRARKNADKKRYREDPVKGLALKLSKKQKYAADPTGAREAAIKYATGVTAAMADVLREQQQGRCAICRAEMVRGSRKLDRECRDHFETLAGTVVPQQTKGATKHPRGLLCGACNIALGMYEKHQKARGLLVIAEYEEYLLTYRIRSDEDKTCT